jgi:protein-L-isoaspartate O-methyltransferase
VLAVDPATSPAALAARYDAIPYDVKPHRLTHPDRLATVATFLGYSPAPPGHCRVLELGCNDGANLIPMAVSLPGSTFVGCDVSPVAIAAGKSTLAALGITNVTLLCQDLATLDPALGSFDYIVAHGVYSWVPAAVRDALFALAGARLAPDGIMFVSYNTFPGGRVRQAAWDMLHHHVDAIVDPRSRLDAARAFARLVADGGQTQHPGDEALRAEMRIMADRTDSELFHDDLAMPNDPVHFRDFAAHAAAHGLAYLAEAELHTMSAAGISATARQFLSKLDPLAREQYLDFVRLRRFRQSLLRRADAVASRPLNAERLAEMHVSADPSLLRAQDAGKLPDMARELDASAVEGAAVRGLLEELVRRSPAALPMADVRRLLAGTGAATPPRPLETLLRDAYVGGVVNLHLQPPAVAIAPPERPRASVLARWQAAQQQQDLTTLVHTRVRVPDPNARQLLQLLDGTRTREQLIAATEGAVPIGIRAQVPAFVDHVLAQFARLGLLAA